jgi:hypothetical protein
MAGANSVRPGNLPGLFMPVFAGWGLWFCAECHAKLVTNGTFQMVAFGVYWGTIDVSPALPIFFKTIRLNP